MTRSNKMWKEQGRYKQQVLSMVGMKGKDIEPGQRMIVKREKTVDYNSSWERQYFR